jgi:hypothetical protein
LQRFPVDHASVLARGMPEGKTAENEDNRVLKIKEMCPAEG